MPLSLSKEDKKLHFLHHHQLFFLLDGCYFSSFFLCKVNGMVKNKARTTTLRERLTGSSVIFGFGALLLGSAMEVPEIAGGFEVPTCIFPFSHQLE
jgi:hypothetical protein